MKFFPDSTASRVRALILLGVLVGLCACHNFHSLWQLAVYQPREGDMVFQSLPHGDLVDAIEGTTGSPWSHCGVVMEVDGGWQVYEAIGQVRRTPLAAWIIRGRGGRFEAYRPTANARLPEGAEFHDKLSATLAPYMGRPYDFRYAPGDEAIYCSELLFKAYRDAFKVEFGEWEKFGELNWRPFEKLIREIEGGPVPLDRPMITPVGMTRSPLLQRVYPKGGS